LVVAMLASACALALVGCAGETTTVSTPVTTPAPTCAYTSDEQLYEAVRPWLAENYPDAWDADTSYAAKVDMVRGFVAESGCDSPGMFTIVTDVLAGNEYMPDCPVDLETGGWTDYEDQLMPYARDLVSAEGSVLNEASRTDFAQQKQVGEAMLTGMNCRVDINTSYAAASAIRGALLEKYPYSTDSGGGTGGSGDVGIPDVDVPDVNPFYCSWSLRGGFNCGVHG
jgi:hypothetical protein